VVLEDCSDAPDTSTTSVDPLEPLPSRSLLIPAPCDPPGARTNWLQHHHEVLIILQVRADARRIPQSAPKFTALRKFSCTRTHVQLAPGPDAFEMVLLSSRKTTARRGSSLLGRQPHRTCFIGPWWEHGLGLDKQPSRPQPQRPIVNTTRVVSRWRDPSPSLLTRCNETLWTPLRICSLRPSYTGHMPLHADTYITSLALQSGATCNNYASHKYKTMTQYPELVNTLGSCDGSSATSMHQRHCSRASSQVSWSGRSQMLVNWRVYS
jgi:hypothetical protein